MAIVILAVFGLILGSFVNAVVYRLQRQSTKGKGQKAKDKIGQRQVDLSISRGRSVCVHCGHELAWYDLVPVFSWLFLRGKCRYCKKPISVQYPLVELATAALFVLSYTFWPYHLSAIIDQLLFAGWLIIVTGFVALIVYDIRWMLLPNRLVYPLMAVAAGLAAIRIIDAGSWDMLLQTALSVAIAGGIFYLIYQMSAGRWIGGGDVKLGFLIGLVLQDPYLAFMMLLLSSTLGTLFILPGLAAKKITPKTQIPFGPFLILATILVFLFGPAFIDWYREVILFL